MRYLPCTQTATEVMERGSESLDTLCGSSFTDVSTAIVLQC